MDTIELFLNVWIFGQKPLIPEFAPNFPEDHNYIACIVSGSEKRMGYFNEFVE